MQPRSIDDAPKWEIGVLVAQISWRDDRPPSFFKKLKFLISKDEEMIDGDDVVAVVVVVVVLVVGLVVIMIAPLRLRDRCQDMYVLA